MHWCDRHFNGTWLDEVCDVLFTKYGDLIIQLLVDGANPDDVCLAIEYASCVPACTRGCAARVAGSY